MVKGEDVVNIFPKNKSLLKPKEARKQERNTSFLQNTCQSTIVESINTFISTNLKKSLCSQEESVVDTRDGTEIHTVDPVDESLDRTDSIYDCKKKINLVINRASSVGQVSC